jgi:type 1 glutamine amidotransferase
MRSVWRSLSAVTAVLLFSIATATADGPSKAELEQIRAAAPDKPLVKPQQTRRVLIYTDCQGFVHGAIPYGSAALRILAAKTGAFEAVVSDDPNVFQPQELHKYDAIVFNNTTGELFTNEGSKHALRAYVAGGGGLVGIHAATDCFYDWPAWGELMGGYFDGHPWNEEVGIRIENPDHPLTKMFPADGFKIADEIYQFRAPYARDNLRVLLSLDTAHTDMTKDGIKRDDGDFAVSWIRNEQLGRVFYCSLGHRHEIFWNPAVLKHYLAGIQFATGDLPANAVVSDKLTDDGWIKLFNGKDTSGWMHKPGAWHVEDGVLTRHGGGDIWSEQRFGDFILELEFKLAPKTNSGVFFRCGSIADWLHTCIEMQVLDSYGKTDPGKHDAGAIYDIQAPSKNMAKPPGEWNQARITARGSRIQVDLNGEQVIDIDLDNWTKAHENPDGTENKFKTAYKDMPRRGHIGLQDHGNPVWYRNIRIKPLD